MKHALAFLLMVAAGARADSFEARYPTADGSGVEIVVSSPYDKVPHGGHVPLRVTITNRMDRVAQWTLETTHARGYSSEFLTVAAGAERTFALSVPIEAADISKRSGTGLRYTITGPGSSGVSMNMESVARGGMTNAKSEIWSKGVDERRKEVIWVSRNDSQNWYHTVLDPQAAPRDWRDYAGFDRIKLTDEEFAQLDPEVRTALASWVATGGDLILIAENAERASEPIGFGRVETWNLKHGKPYLREFVEDDNPPFTGESVAPNQQAWIEKNVGRLQVNLPLLSGLLVLLAALMGPVNIFLLAPARRRQRLFWTTPGLALGATGLAWVVILWQDGTGGAGSRQALVFLQADRHQAVILQAQAARTGVVFRDAFTIEEEVQIDRITDNAWNARLGTRQTGRRFSGDWFESRSIQGQLLTVVRPTRAALTLTNPDSAQAPVLLSSFEKPLGPVFYYDTKGKVWQAETVIPGTPVSCVPAEDDPPTFFGPQNSALSDRLDRFAARPGYFFASASAPPGGMIGTLETIRWESDETIIVGLISKAGPP